MELKLSDDHLKQVLSGAILQMIAPEQREELLRGALADLMMPKKPSYSSGPAVSRIQELFNDAAVQIARDVIRAELERDGAMRTAIAAAAVASLTKVVTDSDLIESMATLIGKAFSAAADAARRY